MNNQEVASEEECLEAKEKWKNYYLSQLPEGLSEDENRTISREIGDLIDRLEYTFKAIYKSGMSLGKNLSGRREFSEERKYSFFIESVARHLEGCENYLDCARDVCNESDPLKRLDIIYRDICEIAGQSMMARM